jgi:RNA polymerase sigma-70 factor (ECF subfamily)
MSDADFEAFVRRFEDMVYATAVRLLGSAADAEDVAQTVFLRAFQRFAALRDSPAAAGWLKTVTRHACLNYLTRYRKRWQLFSEIDRDADRTPYETTLLSTESPTAQMELDEQREALERALYRLPDHQRVPLVLFHFEELGYREIAALLGVSLGKVKTDILRGREALRRYLRQADASR